MRIGIVRRGYSATGGAESYLLRLAGGLAAAGHQPVLIASSDWPASAWPHEEVCRLPGRTPSAFASSFARVRGEFDVTLALERVPGCDVFRAGDGVHAAWLKRRAVGEPRWKSLLRAWNPKHATLLMLERKVFASTGLVIANSRMVAREITEYFSYPKDRLKIIPNGIASSVPLIPREDARAKLGIEPGTYCGLFLGTGWDRKGLRTAVQAMDNLPGKNTLIVAGRGNAAAFAGRTTKFLGPTGDLTTIFSAADVFVLPTVYDPFSNACLEALASGLPVLTTTANGFAEAIVPGVHGDIVEPGNPAQLTEALARWQTHNHAATATACRNRAAEFSLASNVASTISVLEAAASIKEAPNR
ncbi:MAG: glycosyltransferase family 4 protein [Terrimicrobiaceae bacterium]